MKTIKFHHFLVLTAIVGLSVNGCNKDTTSSPGSTTAITQTDVATAQDAETQDAVIEQVNQDADNTMDNLESNNFNYEATKSASDCATVTISPKDTIVFPKTITIDYNCIDTVNGEYMTQTGQLVIVVDTFPVGRKLPWRAHLMRTITFNDFSVSTDSSSFTINGTRTLIRKAASTKALNSLTKRTEVKDSIASDLTFLIKDGSSSYNMTWHSNRARDAFRHFTRFTENGFWHPAIAKDSIIFTGTVYGVNPMGNNYSRTITTPLVYTHCPFWPNNLVIPSGVINYTVGSGTLMVSYSADGCKTIITLTRNGVTRTIERRIGRGLKVWWKK